MATFPAGHILTAAEANQFRQTQTAVPLISFTTQTSFTLAVTFPVAFSATPNVHANINSGAAATAGWHSRAINPSPTGFSIFVFTSGAAATWSNIPVAWTAVSST